MKTLTFKIIGDLDIVVIGEANPADAEWNGYVSAIVAEEERGLDLSKLRTLVFTDGGGPNAAQRKQINDALRGRASRVAMVSSSAVARAILTALAWFNPDMKLFSPEQVIDAFRFLKIPELKYDETWKAILALRMELGMTNMKSIIQGISVPRRR